MPNAFFTGRLSGTTTALAFMPRIAGVVLLMRLSLGSLFGVVFFANLFDRIPSREALRGPTGCHGFHQPVSGMIGRKGNALGLARLETLAIEMVAMQAKHGGEFGAVGQRQHHGAPGFGAERRLRCGR